MEKMYRIKRLLSVFHINKKKDETSVEKKTILEIHVKIIISSIDLSKRYK